MAWTSAIANYDQILDNTDRIVGGSTGYTYGVRNRFYAKRRPAAAGRSARRVRSSRSSCSRPTTRTRGRRRSTRSTRPATAARSRVISRRSCSPCAPSRPWSSTRRPALNSTAGIGSFGRFRWPARTPGARSCSPPSAGAREHSSRNSTGSTIRISSTTPSTSLRRCARRDNKYGSVYSLNYDILRDSTAQPADHGVLQRAVLWHRIRVPEGRLLLGVVRPPLLHVLHACRARQFFAVQRRPRRRAALMLPDDHRRARRARRALSFCDLCG